MNEFERAIKAATDLLTAMAAMDRTAPWASLPQSDHRRKAHDLADRLHNAAIENFATCCDDLSPPSLER